MVVLGNYSWAGLGELIREVTSHQGFALAFTENESIDYNDLGQRAA